MKRLVVFALLLSVCSSYGLWAAAPSVPRTVLSLDGQWEIARGGMQAPPGKFERKVPVPGLAELARPAFEDTQSSAGREAFWYRRSFELKEPIAEVARLKVSKAAYGSRVLLNGVAVGEHFPSFTPGYFDVRHALRAGKNELLVRVGGYPQTLPATVVRGLDFEKSRYTAGIFDSVELILSGSPYITNVQAAPDLEKKAVRVQTLLRHSAPGQTSLSLTVREWKSRRVVGQASCAATLGAADSETTAEAVVPIQECRLWSPEDPFLYELEVRSEADVLTTRFGMRSFRFDHDSGRAMLNGRPYFLRGSNVTLYRFFEDSQRGSLPWQKEWVRHFHQSLRQMNWNSLRYCIGFPPEFWYEIADEEGILIQDEFPIWNRNDEEPQRLERQQLVSEYTEWMRERWNHPCVVIWDAQNESRSRATGQALQQVRGLDLSNRPWNNGWGANQDPGDCYESHPYVFNRPGFELADLCDTCPTPDTNPVRNAERNPILINEYGWLWINRDGTPTTLSRNNYARLLGEKATPEQRRELYARYVAALTEFWRCHRACAGVLHFCALGYSRPNGQTCDNFLDVASLTYEPNFVRYVGDAFAPVGIMIADWDDEMLLGQERKIPVKVVNDLDKECDARVRLRLLADGKTLSEQTQPCKVTALGDELLTFTCAIPTKPGKYQLEAALLREGAKPVCSLRDFKAVRELTRMGPGLELNKPVEASSVVKIKGADYAARYAVDGDRKTRWASEPSGNQWLKVDLERLQRISRVDLLWERAFAKAFKLEVSADGQQWKEVYSTRKGMGSPAPIRFKPVEARWVRLTATEHATKWGASLWEMRVYGEQ